MKKFLVLVLALAMVLTMSAAFAESEKTSLSIVLRDGTYADVIESCLDQFKADNNCEIEVLRLSEDDLKSKIALDAMNAEGAYDLCMVDGSWMAEFASNGVLADLDRAGL